MTNMASQYEGHLGLCGGGRAKKGGPNGEGRPYLSSEPLSGEYEGIFGLSRFSCGQRPPELSFGVCCGRKVATKQLCDGYEHSRHKTQSYGNLCHLRVSRFPEE